MGGSEDAEFILNTDYNPLGLSAQDLNAQVLAWQSGAISKETMYENLQRGEIANPDRTFEDEEALITNQGTGMQE